MSRAPRGRTRRRFGDEDGAGDGDAWGEARWDELWNGGAPGEDGDEDMPDWDEGGWVPEGWRARIVVRRARDDDGTILDVDVT